MFFLKPEATQTGGRSIQRQALHSGVGQELPPPRILLVDDDEMYGKILARAASQAGIDLVYCRSLEEFGKLKDFDFDVALIDYDLGAVTGCELTVYLEHYTKSEVPVVLISQSELKRDRQWPSSIQEFILKDRGPHAALEAACGTYENHKRLSQIGLRFPG